MSIEKPTLQGHSVLHKLEDTSLGRKRNDRISSHAEVPALGLSVSAKNHVDQFENLLHHRILSHIVAAFAFELHDKPMRRGYRNVDNH